MAKNASIVEINGNRYDAVSGHVIGAVKKVAAQVKNPANGVIDGLTRRPSLSLKPSAKTTSTSKAQVAPKTLDRLRYKSPNVRRQMQRSQTLMRNVVKRPTNLDKQPASAPKLHKSRTAAVSPVRLSHAKTVAKSPKVDRFGKLQTATVAAARKVSSRPAASQSLAKKAEPVSAKAAVQPLPSMVTSASHQHLERLLDHALTHASSHKQTLRSTTKGWRRIRLAPKWLTIGTSSLALLLLAGFFAWQNIPQISMRVAATRAHVSASVPAYTPAGYSVAGPIQADSTQVTINYKDTTTPHSFAISQQASNWDSSSVAANAVPAGSQVQTSQVNGTTVYIYGDNNDAKWVNHGVLFSLKDQANLSSDQILKIANGL